MKRIYDIFCYSFYSPLKNLRAARYGFFYDEQVTDSFSTKIGALQIPALRDNCPELVLKICEIRSFTKKLNQLPIPMRFEQKCQATFSRIGASAFFYS